MLISLLPGIRDLRTPLAVGGTWLACIWLLVLDRVPLTASDAPPSIRPAYAIIEFAGPGGILGVLSFLAYVLGVISLSVGVAIVEPLLRRIRRWLPPSWEPIGAGGVSAQAIAQFDDTLFRIIVGDGRDARWRDLLFAHSRSSGGSVRPFLSKHLNLHGQYYNIDSLPGSAANVTGAQAIELERRLGDVIKRIRASALARRTLLLESLDRQFYLARYKSELRELPSRLISSHPPIYERWDRLDSEAEFRYGVAFPVGTLVVVVGSSLSEIVGSIWIAVGSVALAAFVFSLLLFAGSMKQREADTQLVQAVTSGLVTTPVMDEAANGTIAWRDPGMVGEFLREKDVFDYIKLIGLMSPSQSGGPLQSDAE